MKLCAIDLGFLYTKAIINHKPIIIKSVVGDSKPLNFKDLDMGLEKEEKDHISSKVDGMEYFVSDLAIDQSDTVLHSLKANRFDSNATKILLSTVFGLGLGQGGHFTYIVSGLPVSHYAKFKDDIKTLFMGEGQAHHQFSVRDGEVVLRGTVKTLEGRFIPQPFGALLDRVLSDKGDIEDKDLAKKTVAVIDPGFGTTDVYVTKALSPVEKLTFSTQTAMNHAYRIIANKIEENFNVTLPLHQIELVVRKGEFRKSGKSYDMKPVIQWALSATAEQLVSEIFNKWKTIHEIDHIILAGGGGIALSPFIMKEFDNISLNPDSQWSIVRGYEKWGKRTWKVVNL